MTHYHVSESAAVAAALTDLGVPARAASRIAEGYPGGRGLAAATAAQVACVARARGIPQWARRVLAAFSLARVAACQARESGTGIRRSGEVAARVRRMIGTEPVECFLAVLLDARQRVIDAITIHRGSLAQVSVHPRDVFRPAVQCGAHSVIVAHNHPSGDCDPSPADVELTARLVGAGSLVGIPVLDHIVVTPHDHASLASLGLMGGEA